MFLNKIHESERKESQLMEVVPVQSGKGCIGKTNDYEIFLWEGTRILENLLGAIAVYCDTKESVSIWVVPSKRKKEGFELQARDSDQGYWRLSLSKWEYCEEEYGTENPLLKRRTPQYSSSSNEATEANEGALKVAASFGGRIVPEEENETLPGPSRGRRKNNRGMTSDE